ncbi:MAG: RagB/SusD family nutrient uptake outer membrane protein, partial [Odoribacter sp.]|nr:RagB/SusD family nutrient uptake outer membrane protein [Odoribacter sp.]
FMDFRGLRLNYYAVKALQARFYLYTGQTKKAYNAAKAVHKVMPVKLSSISDFNLQYYAAPSECLFALSNHKLIDYSISVTGVGSDRLTGTTLFISAEMRDKLYEGQDITTHTGYANSWNTSIPDANGNYNYACVKKYYYDADQSYSASDLLMKLQVVPMLRMSEVYLILLETTTDLEEANRLYADYMAARNVNVSTDFTDLAEVKNYVLEEIRREFYAEGHMFYAYKRQGIRKMLWGAEEIGEAEYILPLPDSEYNPGTESND